MQISGNPGKSFDVTVKVGNVHMNWSRFQSPTCVRRDIKKPVSFCVFFFAFCFRFFFSSSLLLYFFNTLNYSRPSALVIHFNEFHILMHSFLYVFFDTCRSSSDKRGGAIITGNWMDASSSWLTDGGGGVDRSPEATERRRSPRNCCDWRKMIIDGVSRTALIGVSRIALCGMYAGQTWMGKTG